MRNIVKKAPTLYLHASFNLPQSWMVCVAASVFIIVVTSWKGADSPWLHGIWKAVWIGLEKSGKGARLISVLNGHSHWLGVHSTPRSLSTVFHSRPSVVSDSNDSYRWSLHKFKGQLVFNNEANIAFHKMILKAYYEWSKFSYLIKQEVNPPIPKTLFLFLEKLLSRLLAPNSSLIPEHIHSQSYRFCQRTEHSSLPAKLPWITFYQPPKLNCSPETS